MKQLLYITVNSKQEKDSVSKTVGRRLVDAIVRKDPDTKVQELDLYRQHIPQLKGCYFENRSAIVSTSAREKLSPEEQREVKVIEALCDQFRDADIYVVAAPMWSLSFPAPLKEYLDCVIQSGKTIEFENNKPHGLLGNKHRVFLYVQSSGASIPWIIRPALNKGLNYVHDITRFLGIDTFDELLADGVGVTEEERRKAIEAATDEIDGLVNRLF